MYAKWDIKDLIILKEQKSRARWEHNEDRTTSVKDSSELDASVSDSLRRGSSSFPDVPKHAAPNFMTDKINESQIKAWRETRSFLMYSALDRGTRLWEKSGPSTTDVPVTDKY